MNLAQVIQRLVVLPPPPPKYTLPKTFQLSNGQIWPYGGPFSIVNGTDDIGGDFAGLVEGAFKANPVVFAVEMARLSLFMQARFQFRNLRSGRPGEYWGDPSLAILEKPWPNGTTGDLLARMLVYADFGGDALVVRRPNRLRPLRPDWCIVVSGSMDDPEMTANNVDADELGVLYFEGGIRSGVKPQVFLSAAGSPNGKSEYAHFAPIPDPLVVNRGMPWLTPVVREVQADISATKHKLAYFKNGATVNLIFANVPGETPDKFKEWVDRFESAHKGVDNAYKALYLSGATTATPVGSSLEQADFRAVQGAGEVRICIAGQVPPTVVGVSEGLQGSSLNAGNFASAMRKFADLWARPMWQNVAGSLEAIVPSPQSNSQLWYDDRDIPALKDDIKDAAEVRSKDAQTIRQLVDAGFKPESVISAVNAGDFTQLKHTGLFSVQLQPPQDKNEPVPVPDPNAMPMDPSAMPKAPPKGAKPVMQDPPKGGSSDSGSAK